MVSTLRPVFCDSRLATSAGEPPARASRRARSVIVARSSCVSWLNCEPRLHPLVISLDKPIHGTLQEADALAAVHHEPAAD